MFISVVEDFYLLLFVMPMAVCQNLLEYNLGELVHHLGVLSFYKK